MQSIPAESRMHSEIQAWDRDAPRRLQDNLTIALFLLPALYLFLLFVYLSHFPIRLLQSVQLEWLGPRS